MCRKPFESPAIQASNHFIVIGGIINIGGNSRTTIAVSRSLNLVDSVPNIPVPDASVQILNDNGTAFPLADSAGTGNYISELLTLDPGRQYRVSVTTSDGNKYLSDLVTPKSAPPIDSVTWRLIYDPVADSPALAVYVNTHDPSNSTHYYRWDYIETFQHKSHFETAWYIQNGLIFPVIDPNMRTHDCWTSQQSNTILLGSSIALSADIISQQPIATFVQNDPRMDIRYSILVRQYPLDLNTYNYWLAAQKNTQSLGGLFDLQPSQVNGNVHGITNTKDPVLGYVSASSITESRIFIDNSSLKWKSNPPIFCPIKITPQDPNNAFIWNYPDTSFGVYYFATGVIDITANSCLDCRYQGGTNVQPPFWQ